MEFTIANQLDDILVVIDDACRIEEPRFVKISLEAVSPVVIELLPRRIMPTHIPSDGLLMRDAHYHWWVSDWADVLVVSKLGCRRKQPWPWVLGLAPSQVWRWKVRSLLGAFASFRPKYLHCYLVASSRLLRNSWLIIVVGRGKYWVLSILPFALLIIKLLMDIIDALLNILDYITLLLNSISICLPLLIAYKSILIAKKWFLEVSLFFEALPLCEKESCLLNLGLLNVHRLFNICMAQQRECILANFDSLVVFATVHQYFAEIHHQINLLSFRVLKVRWCWTGASNRHFGALRVMSGCCIPLLVLKCLLEVF